MSKTDQDPEENKLSAHQVLFLFRSSFAFVLGGIFMAIPLMEIETEKPWYYWVGSGLAAFAFGIVLCYIGTRWIE